MFTTDQCEFNKETGDLSLPLTCAERFPERVEIESVRTGRTMAFKRIGPEHPRYDEDGWDGEMALYEPDNKTGVPCNVKVLTLWYGI